MTTIAKLSLQGVRSYSDKQPETIEFFKPLTIIVGANGSGKTVSQRIESEAKQKFGFFAFDSDALLCCFT